MSEETKKTGLELLREPFEAHHISKLPKPTKKQTDTFKAAQNKGDWSLGIKCKVCGGWHHKDVIHLDYVGHAALTDRLLDCDINWDWSPLANDTVGLPAMDNIAGLWIKLTVCGQTRIGYGSSDGKTGGNAIKECIGDALRNAAMRFGAALDLWHKGDLHVDEPEEKKAPDISVHEKDDPNREQWFDEKLKACLEQGDLDKLAKSVGKTSWPKDLVSKMMGEIKEKSISFECSVIMNEIEGFLDANPNQNAIDDFKDNMTKRTANDDTRKKILTRFTSHENMANDG